jgi:hypothetical protein
VILGFSFSDRAPGTTPSVRVGAGGCFFRLSKHLMTEAPSFVITAPKKRADHHYLIRKRHAITSLNRSLSHMTPSRTHALFTSKARSAMP